MDDRGPIRGLGAWEVGYLGRLESLSTPRTWLYASPPIQSFDMFDYFAENNWAVQRVWFDFLNGRYTGRGLLKWHPDNGFYLDAFLTRHGPPLPSTIEWGKPRVLRPEELGRIRMRLGPGAHVLSAPICLSDQMELFSDDRLEVDFHSALFVARRSNVPTQSNHSGRALLEVGKRLILPDSSTTEVRVGGKTVRQAVSRDWIDHEEPSLSLRAFTESDKYMQTEWLMPSSEWSKMNAWRFAEALGLATSIVSGKTVHLLEKSCVRGQIEYHERRSRRPVTDLGLMRLIPEPGFVPKDILVHLAKEIARDAKYEKIARNVFNQLAEASRQQTHEGRELLCSMILHAVLLTASGKKYKPGDPSTKIAPCMESFRIKYLSDSWDNACKKAEDAFHELRHRNAHPDWLTIPGGGRAEPSLEESLNNMIFLSTFYGYMLLALAGFKNLQPRFPTPIKDWQALITMTFGVSTP